MKSIRITTIGFTQVTAKQFFSALEKAKVRRVIDVRLNNKSQLSGFSKQNDLQYFLKAIASIEYIHLPFLAPTKEMLRGYRAGKCPWEEYERRFVDLITAREIEKQVDPSLLSDGCLLCSEHEPHHCHRRLVAEYLKSRWANVLIEHIGIKEFKIGNHGPGHDF